MKLVDSRHPTIVGWVVGLCLSGQMTMTLCHAAALTTHSEFEYPTHFETSSEEDVLLGPGIEMRGSADSGQAIGEPLVLIMAPVEETTALALRVSAATRTVASVSLSGTQLRGLSLAQLSPSVRTTLQDPNAPSPNPPELLTPDNGVTFNEGSATATGSKQFRWKRAAAGLAPQFYRFTMEDADNPAGFKTGIVEIPHAEPVVSTSQIISLYFGDKRVRWNVSACVRGGSAASSLSFCSRNSSHIFTWVVPPPQPPTLLQPVAGVVATPGDVSFSWQTSSKPSSYLLCISKPGIACPSSETDTANTIVIRKMGNQNTAGQVNVSRFLDQTVNWTVASCDGQNRCAYQQNVRPFRVERELPQLLTPGYGMTAGVRPHFEWTTVPWAQIYLLCVSKPGIACPTQGIPAGSNPSIVVKSYLGGQTGDPTASLAWSDPPDLTQFSGSAVHWTVAACQTLFQGGPPTNCRYQPQYREVRIGDAWSVQITLDRLDVHDRYDNVSPGDWRLNYVLMKTTSLGGLLTQVPTAFHKKEWPREDRGSRDANNGKALKIGESFWISMSPSEQLTAAVGVIDCDVDGLFTLANVFNGIEGVIDTVRNWTQYCGGEEIYEVTGENDYVGTAVLTLVPRDWMNRSNFGFTAPGLGGANGTTAFTAHFIVTSSRN